MKTFPTAPLALFAALLLLPLGGCASRPASPPPLERPAATGGGKTVATGAEDDLDEYAAAADISDPIEPVNRGVFWANHQLYRYVFRPIANGYKFIVPKPVRKGLDNAFDNVRFPIRFVNHTLQGNLRRSAQETGKFLVNTTAGVGGLYKAADHVPVLSDVPAADSGQTFAKWGLPRGPYIVLPVLGPSTAREAVGLAGDYALNPISWATIIWGGDYAWIVAIPYSNTVRSLPGQLDQYDAATENSLDNYLAARTAYLQYRDAVNKRR